MSFDWGFHGEEGEGVSFGFSICHNQPTSQPANQEIIRSFCLYISALVRKAPLIQ